MNNEKDTFEQWPVDEKSGAVYVMIRIAAAKDNIAKYSEIVESVPNEVQAVPRRQEVIFLNSTKAGCLTKLQVYF